MNKEIWVTDFEALDQATDLIAESFLILTEYKKKLESEKGKHFSEFQILFNNIKNILQDLDSYCPNHDLCDSHSLDKQDENYDLEKSEYIDEHKCDSLINNRLPKSSLIMSKFDNAFGNKEIEDHLDKMSLNHSYCEDEFMGDRKRQ